MMYEQTTSYHVPEQPQATMTGDHVRALSEQQAFVLRNQRQRDAADAKNLADATAIIHKQTAELNEAARYNERINAEYAAFKARAMAAIPELRTRLYAPMWMIPAARGDPYQPVPNTLWLITSLALIAAGIAGLVL